MVNGQTEWLNGETEQLNGQTEWSRHEYITVMTAATGLTGCIFGCLLAFDTSFESLVFSDGEVS